MDMLLIIFAFAVRLVGTKLTSITSLKRTTKLYEAGTSNHQFSQITNRFLSQI